MRLAPTPAVICVVILCTLVNANDDTSGKSLEPPSTIDATSSNPSPDFSGYRLLPDAEPSCGPVPSPRTTLSIVKASPSFPDLECNGESCECFCAVTNETSIPASYCSNTTVVCDLNNVQPGDKYQLSVSINGTLIPGTASFSGYTAPVVSAMYPKSGPLSGGTPLKITGKNLRGSCHPGCRFDGKTWVSAVFLQDQREVAVCTSPPGDARGQWVKVEWSGNGGYDLVEFPEGESEFHYYGNPRPVDFLPLSGPLRGNSNLTVAGYELAGGTNTSCRFSPHNKPDNDYVIVTGSLKPGENSSLTDELSCATPEWTDRDAEDIAALSISLNGVDWIDVGSFYYYSLVSLAPICGVSQGGTSVTFGGVNLQHHVEDFPCRFGDIVVAGKSKSDVVICPAPSGGNGTVVVDIAPNGVDYTGSGLEYFYYTHPEVMSASPQTGPERGGTTVIMKLKEAATIPNGCNPGCYFGPDMVGATLNGITVLCSGAPPGSLNSTDVIDAANPAAIESDGDLAKIRLSLAVNSQDKVKTDFKFAYYRATGLYPLSGSSAGGTQVRVAGQNFINSELAVCKFKHESFEGDDSQLVVKATRVSSTEFVCPAPEVPEGIKLPITAEVAFNMNENEKGDDTAIGHFKFFAPPTPGWMSPTAGPLRGGTDIIVYGRHLSDGTYYRCLFSLPDGDVEVEAQFVSVPGGGDSIACTTPSALPADGLSLNAAAPAPVKVSVTLNGVEFITSPSMAFQYYPDPEVISIHPSAGIFKGDIPVTLTGRGLDQGVDWSCKFGASIVSGELQADGSVICNNPPGDGEVRVALSLNGVNWHDTGLNFHYYSSGLWIAWVVTMSSAVIVLVSAVVIYRAFCAEGPQYELSAMELDYYQSAYAPSARQHVQYESFEDTIPQIAMLSPMAMATNPMGARGPGKRLGGRSSARRTSAHRRSLNVMPPVGAQPRRHAPSRSDVAATEKESLSSWLVSPGRPRNVKSLRSNASSIKTPLLADVAKE